jgi:hypothetical protein
MKSALKLMGLLILSRTNTCKFFTFSFSRGERKAAVDAVIMGRKEVIVSASEF